MTQLEFHPYANLFPLIEGDAFADLVADVDGASGDVHGRCGEKAAVAVRLEDQFEASVRTLRL